MVKLINKGVVKPCVMFIEYLSKHVHGVELQK